jgi:hypothetical protein
VENLEGTGDRIDDRRIEAESDAADFLGSAPSLVSRRRREQIVAVFPALVPILPEFADVIDRAEPFVDAVATRLQAKKCVIRHLGRVPNELIDNARAHITWIIACLERSSPDKFPTTDDQWYDFIDAQRGLDELAELCGQPAAKLCRACDGRWADVAAAAHKAREQPFLRLPKPDGLAAQVTDFFRVVFCPEVCIELRRRGIDLSHIVVDQAAILKEHVNSEIVRLRYRQKEPLEILRTVADWAANLGSPLSHPAACARKVWAPLSRMDQWPPIIEHPVVAPNGLWIVPLSSPMAIFGEGRMMQHCIGKYAGRLTYYPFHALSVRTTDGFRLASAILEAPSRANISIWDFNGFRNCGTDLRARNALDWFITAMSNGSVFVDWPRMEAEREARWHNSGGRDAAIERLQFNFYDENMREWAWTGFHQLFASPPYSGLSRNELMLHSGLREMAAERAETIAAMDLSSCKPSETRLLSPWNERM